MARYDRSYDYGLRGYRETTSFGPARGAPPRAWGYDRDFAYPRTAGGGLTRRVTARYNRDYTYDRPYRGFERNYSPYNRIDRVGDMSDYLHSYNTVGGTRTARGAYQPPRDPRQDDVRGGYDRDFRRGRR